MALSTEPDFYLNMQQFSQMKLGARNHTKEATTAAAQQFESLFVQQMLTAMRSASIVDEAAHSTQADFYQEMYDKQLAQTITKQGGFGIADMLIKQLPGGQNDSGSVGKDLPAYRWQESSSVQSLNMPAYQALNPAVKVNRLEGLNIDQAAIPAQAAHRGRWDEPAGFVSDIWPHAEKASNVLGISAEALIAQSALETGWGKHTMLSSEGKPAFNIFGIKAGGSWSGDTLARPTLEFRDGVMQTEIAHFRVYESIAAALDDYVDFIQSSPRYRDALEHQGDDVHYLRELQRGGYATDPDYADKIINIMRGPTFGASLANLDVKSDSDMNEAINHG